VYEEYSGRYALPLWNGYHIFAVDGSYLQLPKTPALAEEYGVRGDVASNRPSAGISVLYDVLHGWALDATITHTDMNERGECAKHIDFLNGEFPHIAERSILLLDRGYPSYDLLQKCEENGIKFVMRCASNSWKAATDAPMGDNMVQLRNGRTVRVVKFMLRSGEAETLFTNLSDLPEAAFSALYAMRWGVETMYHQLKCVVGVEQFSGKTPNAIRQDFWASMVLLNTAAIFQKEADEAVVERQKSKNIKHFYRARTSDLIVTLRDRLIFARLCGHPSLTDWELSNILRELSRAVSPVRPGRSFPRVRRSYASAKHNLKSVL
jgi:hypothetical protein